MNIEQFVNDYLQEHRHEVLLNPYNGLIEFAKVFQEKMMEEWLKDRDGCFWDGVNEGKKAMEEQMMKGAVEGYVTLTLTGVRTVAATIKEEDDIGLDDKVRIIIVKE